MCVPGCMETVRKALPPGALPRASAGTSRAAANGALTSTVVERLACAAVGPFASVLDLTHTLSSAFPVFPGDPTIDVTPYARLGEDGYNMNAWQLVEHSGTHLDAPIHFCDEGASVDAIEAAALVVPGKAQENADYLLSRDDLAAWETRYGMLPQGGCVAMHSGWGGLATADPARFIGRDADGTLHFPGIAPEAARWLLQECYQRRELALKSAV